MWNGKQMKNVSDSLDELMRMMEKLDKKLDTIIEKNEPPQDVIELFDKIREENRNPKYICDKCESGTMVLLDNGKAYATNPLQYDYECNECGHRQVL